MKIEINSGGLQGNAIIDEMKADVSRILTNSLRLDSAFSRIKAYAMYTNGTAQNVNDAISLIEQRERAEQQRANNIRDASRQVEKFINDTRTVDRAVAQTIGNSSRNTGGFGNGGSATQAVINMSDAVIEWADKTIKDELEKILTGLDKLPLLLKLVDEISSNGMSKRELAEMLATVNEYHTKYTDLYYDNTEHPGETSINDNRYGGNQLGPYIVFNEPDNYDEETRSRIKDIIRRNLGINLSEEELEDMIRNYGLEPKNVYESFLNEKKENGKLEYEGLNHRGCSYTALTNTIFEYYLRRENGAEEFERKFGFPMKDSKGRYNYELIIVDMYTHFKGFNRDGMNSFVAEHVLEDFMANSGCDGNSSVKVDMMRNCNVTPQNIDVILNSGCSVIIHTQNILMYKNAACDDRPVSCAGAGHAMTITGVTADGHYIVSSWGEKYYINPEDLGKSYEYKNDKNEKKTVKVEMNFSVIKYD